MTSNILEEAFSYSLGLLIDLPIKMKGKLSVAKLNVFPLLHNMHLVLKVLRNIPQLIKKVLKEAIHFDCNCPKTCSILLRNRFLCCLNIILQ